MSTNINKPQFTDGELLKLAEESFDKYRTTLKYFNYLAISSFNKDTSKQHHRYKYKDKIYNYTISIKELLDLLKVDYSTIDNVTKQMISINKQISNLAKQV